MRSLLVAMVAVSSLALAACGGDDEEEGTPAGGSATAPATAPATTPTSPPATAEPGATDAPEVSRSSLQSCVEGEGLEVYTTEERIPGLEGGRLEVGLESAEQIAVFWPDSEHVADVFVAEAGDAADRAEQELVEFFSAFGLSAEQAGEFVLRTGNVIVTPDDEIGPDEDELAVLRGCIES